MEIDDLTIGDAKRLACLFGNGTAPHADNCCGGIRIVILQRGWVIVGRYSQTGDNCRIDDGYVIRNWGTTKGLGEIAKAGPTEKTVLDPMPTCHFHALTVVAQMECEEKKWKCKIEV